MSVLLTVTVQVKVSEALADLALQEGIPEAMADVHDRLVEKIRAEDYDLDVLDV